MFDDIPDGVCLQDYPDVSLFERVIMYDLSSSVCRRPHDEEIWCFRRLDNHAQFKDDTAGPSSLKLIDVPWRFLVPICIYQ